MKYILYLRDVCFVLSKSKVLDPRKSNYISEPYKEIFKGKDDEEIRSNISPLVLPESINNFGIIKISDFSYDIINKKYSHSFFVCTKVVKVDDNGVETILAEYTKDVFEEEKKYLKKYRQTERDFKDTFLSIKKVVKQELNKIYGDDYIKHNRSYKFNNKIHTIEIRYPVLIDLGGEKTFVKYIHIIGDLNDLNYDIYCTYNDVKYTDYNKLFEDIRKETNKQDDIQ